MSDVAVQLLVGLLTVVAAFYAARSGARATQASTDALDRAARREEWFRRVQWAAGLTLAAGTRSQADGLALLAVLARSDLADADDEHLIEALNHNDLLDDLERQLTGRPGAAPRVAAPPDPVAVEAARLRIVLDEQLHRPTTGIVRSLAGPPAP